MPTMGLILIGLIAAMAFASPKRMFIIKGTGYYPDASRLEGGFVDRLGKPLRTLQDFLAGRASYVSVAMDPNIPYGTGLRVLELEVKYGKVIPFRVTDTGDSFIGKGFTRLDVCTANYRASLDNAINAPLHVVVTSLPTVNQAGANT